MRTFNRVTLVGNIGSKPQCGSTNNGTATANLSLATHKEWIDKNGEKQKKTEWHKISVFGNSAEFCEKYVGSGDLVLVEGEITTSKWKTRDGDDRKESVIRAFRVIKLTTAENSHNDYDDFEDAQ